MLVRRYAMGGYVVPVQVLAVWRQVIDGLAGTGVLLLVDGDRVESAWQADHVTDGGWEVTDDVDGAGAQGA